MEEDKTSSMFDLSGRDGYIIDRSLLKKDFIQYNPDSMSTINDPTTLIRFNIPRANAYINLHDSYLELEFDVTKAADGSRYGNDNTAAANDIALVNLGPVAVLREVKLSSSAGKTIEHVENVYQATLIYKMLSSGLHEKDQSIGVVSDIVGDQINDSRKRRLINGTTQGNIFMRINLRDVLGFVDKQDKVTYGFGYSLELKRVSSDNALLRNAGADEARLNVKDIKWYVSHYTPSIENQNLVAEHVLAKKNTTLSYIERTTSFQQVNSNNRWTWNLGVESGSVIPIYIIVGFQTAARYGPSQTTIMGYLTVQMLQKHCVELELKDILSKECKLIILETSTLMHIMKL